MLETDVACKQRLFRCLVRSRVQDARTARRPQISSDSNRNPSRASDASMMLGGSTVPFERQTRRIEFSGSTEISFQAHALLLSNVVCHRVAPNAEREWLKLLHYSDTASERRVYDTVKGAGHVACRKSGWSGRHLGRRTKFG